MKATLFAIVTLLLLLQTVPVAAQITSYSVDAIVSEKTVSYRVGFHFAQSKPNFLFSITGSPENVNTTPNTCVIDKALLQTNIICNSPIKDFEVDYNSDESIRRKTIWGGYIWSDIFKIPETANNFSLDIRLPPGAALKEPTSDAIDPEGAMISSDGRHILISWSQSDVSDKWTGSIAYERIEIAAVLPTLLAIITIVIAVGVITYRHYFKNEKDSMKVILPILKKDEKAVLDALMKHGSGVNQKIIVKESGYSKAKVSKVLKSLVERKIVKLERIGRSNKIIWVKELKKER